MRASTVLVTRHPSQSRLWEFFLDLIGLRGFDGHGHFPGMKTCPYCGKEYSDDVVLCAVDRYELEPPIPSSTLELSNAQILISPAPIPRTDGRLVFPEYRWSQWDAWMFFGVMVVIDMNWPMLMEFFDAFMSYAFHSSYSGGPWLNMPTHRPLPYLFPFSFQRRADSFSYDMTTLAYAGVCTLAVVYIARANSIASFCKAVGLDRKPTIYGWFGALAAIGIRAGGHVIYSASLTKNYPNFEVTDFLGGYGSARFLFLFPLLYAAFWEEPVYRGFLFKAFRGSYSVLISTALVIGFTVYMHWDEYFQFGLSAILLTAFTMVQCWLREKSASLWDCILSHLVYNLTGLFLAGILLY